jgi:hypothetical protein
VLEGTQEVVAVGRAGVLEAGEVWHHARLQPHRAQRDREPARPVEVDHRSVAAERQGDRHRVGPGDLDLLDDRLEMLPLLSVAVAGRVLRVELVDV